MSSKICLFSAKENIKVYELKDSVFVFANRYEYSQKFAPNLIEIISPEQFRLSANHSLLQLVDVLSPSAFVLEKKVIGFGVGSAGGGLLNMRGMGANPIQGF